VSDQSPHFADERHGRQRAARVDVLEKLELRVLQ
jgi:hypothetical protein